MRNFQTVLLVMLSLFLVSCFENETKVSSKQNVQDVMEQRQNMAATYARSLQLHAAATVDVLLDQASIQGDHVSNLSEAGTIAGLLESGLIDSQAFAALDAGGDGALNTGRQRNMMQSGYCDGVLYTWVAGTVNDNGAVERPRLKGLGEAGLGSVAQVLSQHVGSNSYGMYKDNRLTTPSGVNVAIECREMAAMIPAGSPVLFQEMASEFELARNGSYYEFENRACANADEDGFDRYRRLVTVAYNNQGDETGRETEEWDLFLESCHNMDAAERISVNLSSSTADQIDFSAQNLDGGSTRSVVCFEANTTKKDAEGEKKDVEQGTSFNNCQSATEFETSLADDIDVECSEDVVRTEEDTRACTGDGWTGTVTYEREIVMCTKNGNGSSIDYEKRGEWERTAVDCSKDEVATASCPFGAGLVSYNRTNKITNPETLAPTNPSWNYTGDNCVTGEISCIGGYAGNGVAFASTANGASNPPVPETTSLNTYCGSGSICEEQRSVSCDVGNKTQRRQYLCNGGWTAWGDHETADCDPGENMVCRYEKGVNHAFRFFNFDQSCTYEENWGIEMIWDSTQEYSRTMPGNLESGDRGDFEFGELMETQRPNGCDSYLFYEICHPQICEPNTLDQEQASCDSGYYGNKTRTRTCNGDGTEYGDWSAWDTSSCQAIICSPGATDSQSQSCPSGYSGQETRTRTCNATGTGYGAWSAWDNSSCVAENQSTLCTSYTFTYPENYGNYYDGSLGAGYMSNRGKGSISPTSDFRGYSISAVKDTEYATSDYQATGIANDVTIQIEGDVRSQIDSIKYSSGLGAGFSHMHNRDLSGNVMYGGGKTYYYTQNTSYTTPGFDGSGSGVIEICGFPVCTPNAVESETSACGSGYSGDQTRTRTCNGDGSAWGAWSSWDESTCTINVGASVNNSTPNVGQNFTLSWNAPAAEVCVIAPGIDSGAAPSGSTTLNESSSGSKTYTVTCHPHHTSTVQSGTASVTVNIEEQPSVSEICESYTMTVGAESWENDAMRGYVNGWGIGSLSPNTFLGHSITGLAEVLDYYNGGNGPNEWPMPRSVFDVPGFDFTQINVTRLIFNSNSYEAHPGSANDAIEFYNADDSPFIFLNVGETHNAQICYEQVCEPNSTERQYRQKDCPQGFFGTENRTRTCNAEGTGYGEWSAWGGGVCERQCPWQDPDTRIWYNCE